MVYLLDTNAISALMRAEARMASWLSSIGVDDRAVICTVTGGEILFGLERPAHGRRRSELGGKARKLFAVLLCEPIPTAAGLPDHPGRPLAMYNIHYAAHAVVP